MKKIFSFLILAISLASCQQYDNTIVSRGLVAGGYFRPLDSAILDSAATGLVHITPSPAGNPLIQDSSLSFSPTWKQSWKWDGERHNRLSVILGVIILGLSFAIFMFLNNRGLVQAGIVIPMMISIAACGATIGGALEWERSGMGLTIPKVEYQTLMKDPGNLGPAWDTIRVK